LLGYHKEVPRDQEAKIIEEYTKLRLVALEKAESRKRTNGGVTT